MADLWYYWDNDKAAGPVPAGAIVYLIKTAILDRETMVRQGADGLWLRANEVPVFAVTASPPPVAAKPNQAVTAEPPAATTDSVPKPAAALPQVKKRPRPNRAEQPASSPALLWGLIGGGVCATALLVVVIFLALRSRTPAPPPEPVNPENKIAQAPADPVAPALPVVEPDRVAPSIKIGAVPTTKFVPTIPPRTDSAPKPVEAPAAPADSVAGLFDFLKDRGEAPKLSGQQVYEQILKSCVFILNPDGSGGSGSLVDAKNRIVITNHHVVQSENFQKLRAKDDGISLIDRIDIFSPPDRVRKSRCNVYSFFMIKGEKFTIDMISRDFDAFLRLENSLGRQLADDNDSGGKKNARIVFTVPANDNYRVIATSFDNKMGEYQLKITPVESKKLAKGEAGIESQTVYVSFPRFEKGAVVTEAKSYVQAMLANKAKYKAKVLYSDPAKDLAIVQLPDLPEYAKPLPLAKESGKPGQSVHSVGNPGASDSFWVYTSGTVRTNPHSKKWKSGGGGRVMNHDATIIETQSPTNPGDSGGPLVNDAGELVAVTQGGSVRANAVNIFIDVSEVKTVLQRKNLGWTEGAELAGKPRTWTSAEVTRLAQLLDHEKAQVRVQAATYLVDAGTQARFALAALNKALDDANADVRRSATLALAAVGAEGVSGLRKALGDASPQVRAAAATGLTPLGAAAQSATPELLAALGDKEGDVAFRALEALAKIGARGPKAIAALAGLSENADAETQKLAGLALEQGLDYLTQNPKDVPEALPTLTKLFTGKSGKLKQSAGAALTRIGAAARPVMPDLIVLVKNSTGAEQIEVLKVAAGVGDRKEKQTIVLPQALQFLADNDEKLKLGALGIFETLGPDGISAESSVLGAYTKERNREVRLQAVKALGALGSKAKAAVPRLVADVTQYGDAPADKEMHQALTGCLVKIGEPAARELLKVATDPKYTVRIRAVDMLGAMGPAVSDVALMPLTRLYNDVEMNPVVRERMKKAIEQIRGN
jgi:S1-C subfamily serine protease/HEAT repeat protein